MGFRQSARLPKGVAAPWLRTKGPCISETQKQTRIPVNAIPQAGECGATSMQETQQETQWRWRR
jgi:hypothetical protein